MIVQPDLGTPEPFEERKYPGVVSAIEAQPSPIIGLDAEITGFLIQRAERRVEVSRSTGIHLVVRIHCERVLRSSRPILVAQEPVPVLLSRAAVIDVAHVNRDIG